MESRTILFIEDDSFVLTMYRNRLEDAGFQVQSAGDGVAAIELLPRVRPDLVVLDLMLPKLHGLEVIKFIRGDVNLKGTPVVILSNVYMEGLAAKAIEAGANAGMLKTQCTPAKLVNMIWDQIGGGPEGRGKASDSSGPEQPANAAEALSEKDCRASAQAELLRNAPQEIARIRQESVAFVKMGGSPASADHLNGLYRRVRFFSARAGLSGCAKITELASALEALLFEIGFKLSRATPSVLHTIAQAVDCLARLVQNRDVATGHATGKRRVLVVDDDEICSYAISAALKRANFGPVSVQDPKAALGMLRESPFDLVLLDINMPGMNGFEVCEELRRIPHHKTTPVIFVTLHGEFQNRARSALAGGDDLITKPISPIELTLKVTIHLLQREGVRSEAPSAADQAKAEGFSALQTVRANGEAVTGASDSHASAAVAASPVATPQPERESLAPNRLSEAGSASNGRTTAPDVAGEGEPDGALAPRFCDHQGPPDKTSAANGSVERQRPVEGWRREQDDLKASNQDLFAELARVNEQLKKALTENEYAQRRWENVRNEQDATQAELKQRRRAEEELRNAKRELDQTVQSQAAELERINGVLKAEQNAFLTSEKAKAEQALAQTRLQQEMEAHAQRAEQWQQEQKALEEQLQAETKERDRLSAELAAAVELGKQAEIRAREAAAEAAAQSGRLAEEANAVEASRRSEASWRGEAEALSARLVHLQAQIHAEVGQRAEWTQRLAEFEQARTSLENQIKQHAEREINLQGKYSIVEEQLRCVNESLAESRTELAQEARRRAAAEEQACDLTKLRTSLEEQLKQRVRTERELRRELREHQARLEGKDQTLSADRSQLEAKIRELQAAQDKATELQDKCADLEERLKSVNDSLAQHQAQLSQEAGHRAAAENQVRELAALRASLEQALAQRTKAEEQLRGELEEHKARMQVQDQTLSAARSQIEERTQELQTAEATVAELREKCATAEKELRNVRESLTQHQAQLSQEAERRVTAEGQASGLTGLRASLEKELARRIKAEEQLQCELEEQKARMQVQDQTLSADRSQLEAKAQELQTATVTIGELRDSYAAVDEQLRGVRESLAQHQVQLSRETERRTAAEGQTNELAGLRTSLEQELARRIKAEEQLRRELEDQKTRLQAQDQTLSADRRELQAKVQELQAAQVKATGLLDKCEAVEKQLKGVNDSLAQHQAQLSHETERRVVAEGQANELTASRTSLEQELARRIKAEEQLRGELEEQKACIQSQDQTLSSDRRQLEIKAQELQAAEATVAELRTKCAIADTQLRDVRESLARNQAQLGQEREHRAVVEGQASELSGLRASLQQELARRIKVEKQLRAELEEQKARVQTQDQTLLADRNQLEAKVQELEAAQGRVTELEDKCAAVKEQLKCVNESLANHQARLSQEAENRAAAEEQVKELAGMRISLEQALAQRTRAEEQLRGELEKQNACIQSRDQTLLTDRRQLEVKAQELQAATAKISELQGNYAGVEEELKSVKESLAKNQARLDQESESRASFEAQANKLVGLQTSLEQELTQRTKVEEQLQHELVQQNARIQSQDQTISADRSQLEAKVQELQAAQATAATLKDECMAVEKQLKSVSDSLASRQAQLSQEAGWRAAAEDQVKELAGSRASLEQALAQRTKAEEQLRRELEEQKTRMQVQDQALSAERNRLETKIQELQTAQATVATLTDKCTAVEEQLKNVKDMLAQHQVQLSQETERRTAAESQARELAGMRDSLTAARDQMAQQALEREKLASKVVEGQQVQLEQARQLADARSRETALQSSIHSLESRLQQLALEQERLESSLQTEMSERRRLQRDSETLRGTLDDVSTRLSEKAAAEQTRTQREAELHGCVYKLQQQVTESGATAAVREAELRSAKGKLAELLLVQSALCARVEVLVAAESALAKERQDLEERLRTLQGGIKDNQRNLAVLRYAILDASWMSSRIGRNRNETLRQTTASMKQFTGTLLNSPLSLAQRLLVHSLQGGLENWMNIQINNVEAGACLIETPVFQTGEFNLIEGTGEALRAMERQAPGTGIEVKVEVSGDVPERIVGDAAHIGQLFGALPESLLSLAEIRRLGLRLAVEPKPDNRAELILELLISVNGPARELCERLTRITVEAEALRSVEAGEGELALAACSQLARALGGTTCFASLTDEEVQVLVVLPVEIASPLDLSHRIPARQAWGGRLGEEFQPRCLLTASSANPSRDLEKAAKV